MNYESVSLFLTVVLPIAACCFSLLFRQTFLQAFSVAVFCGLIILNSCLLFFAGNIYLSACGLSAYIYSAAFLLCIFVLFLGVKSKKNSVIISAVVQIALLIWLVLIKRYDIGHTPLFYADAISKLILCVGSCLGGVFALLWIRYSPVKKKNKNESSGSLILILISIFNVFVMLNNILFLPSAISAAGLAGYLVIDASGERDAYKSASEWLSCFTSAALFFALASFIIILCYGEDGVVMTELLKRSVLKSSKRFVLAIALSYVSAFVLCAMPPFAFWMREFSKNNYLSFAAFNIFAVNMGVYLIFRFAPSFSPMFFYGSSSGLTIGSSIVVFGAFSYFACSYLSLISNDLTFSCSLSSAGTASLAVLCVGLGASAALVGAIFLWLFHSLFTFLIICSLMRSSDVVAFWTLRLGVYALFAPPFGVFISYWILLISVSNSFLPFDSSNFSFLLFNAFLFVSIMLSSIGVCVSFSNGVKRLVALCSRFSFFKIFRISGLSIALSFVAAFAIFLNLNIPILYIHVKSAVLNMLPSSSFEPNLIFSFFELASVKPVSSASETFLFGVYPLFSAFAVFASALALFFVFYFIEKKEKPLSCFISIDLGLINCLLKRFFSGKYAVVCSYRYVNAFFSFVSCAIMIYIAGVALGSMLK